MNTAIVAGRCIYKKCDTPISPSDPQASRNNEWRLPPYKKCMSVANSILGLQEARVATGED